MLMSKSYIVCNHTAIHNGNQFKKVTDQCDELTYAGAMDFKDGANEQVEYTWDANGNMTSDLNKGISEIKYNVFNLPEKITHNNGHITYITYAADGRKLRVTYKINPLIAIGDPVIHPGEPIDPIGPLNMLPANELNGNNGRIPLDPQPVSIERVIMTRDYCGAYTYRNGAIERILMGNGFMQDSAYYVQVKDYQGNVRAVLDQNHNVVERNDYYPYGGLINASDTQLQPYKYSSKELDRENGLDLYDSQARWYDPMLPQTTTQDPLAEKYFSISPYTWCAGNPVRFIDPSGKTFIINNVRAQQAMIATVPKADAEFIRFNKGKLDRNLLLSHESDSKNYQKRIELEMAPEIITVDMATSYKYRNNKGKVIPQRMSYQQDDSFLDPNITNAYSNITGEIGETGISLMPGKKSKNSLDKYIHVILNSKLSDIGAASNFSHEVNGHVLLYVRTHDRVRSGHQFGKGNIDNNKELMEYIFESLKETIENLKKK